MRLLRIYVAGPMTGLPELNFPAFHAATATLRAQGHEVVNPAEINPDVTMAWHACMRRDIAELVTCDAIHLLNGWQHSKGATLEHHIAERLGLVISEDKSGNFSTPVNLVEPVALTVESAHAMGAKGAIPTESERQLFEAWMRGHCWGYSDTWTGSAYQDRPVYLEEKCCDPLAMQTRQLWAAWRDCAALHTPFVQPCAPLTQAQVEAFAHRRATKYTHRSNPTYHSYAFVPHTLMDFVGDIERAARGEL